jgi:DnaJ-domain-containing protein 1
VIARFDLAWPDFRVAVEFQSYRHHFGRRAWRRDAGRVNRATAAGWCVFMATEDDLRQGCQRLGDDIAAVRRSSRQIAKAAVAAASQASPRT